MKKNKVLFTTNIPSPYRVKFFNELGKYCDLTVLFEKGESSERDETWEDYHFENFKGIILSGKSVDVDKAFSPGILKYIHKRKYDFIIIANTITPTGILAIFYMKIFHVKYYLEGDGAIVKTEPYLKKMFKTCLMRKAKGYFSTSKSLDIYYKKYGANEEKIFRYPFSSVLEINVKKEILTKEEKIEVRRKIGIQEENVVLCVGQFIYRKGFDVILREWNKIDSQAGLYIVGGEACEDYIEIVKAKQLRNVHFVTFKGEKELQRFYDAADVFVLPTREDIWGLVVNEAMANGLPVITTDRCVSGMEMVEDGSNGYIVPVEDGISLIERIDRILQDVTLKEIMSRNALETAREYTIENMALRHINIISDELNKE